jgi:FlaA1/EpsC-like NDP-sugar epimerase
MRCYKNKITIDLNNKLLEESVVIITGGGGSIGSLMTQSIMKQDVVTIVVDLHEPKYRNLYSKLKTGALAGDF